MASIVWFEIPADDVERANKFYGSLFGWKIGRFPGPGPGVGKLLARMLTGQETEADAATLKELTPYRTFAGTEALK